MLPKFDAAIVSMSFTEAADRLKYKDEVKKMSRQDLEEMFISMIDQYNVQKKMVVHLMKNSGGYEKNESTST